MYIKIQNAPKFIDSLFPVLITYTMCERLRMIFMLTYVQHEQDQLDADLALHVHGSLGEALDRSPTVRCTIRSHSLQEFYEHGY